MAVGDAHVFPGFLTPVLTQLSFLSYRLLFSHASAEVRGENTLERKFASAGYRTHNHQVMSPDMLTTEPGGAKNVEKAGLAGSHLKTKTFALALGYLSSASADKMDEF